MQAILLFAHGARAESWARPFRAIQDRLRDQRPGIAVELAFLEFMAPDFATAIDRLNAQGATQVLVCPLFLGVGGHVLRDLPALVDTARTRWPELSIECAGSPGDDPQVLDALAQYCLRQFSGPG
jgi:sirohydrochlorin cobaltochelatase